MSLIKEKEKHLLPWYPEKLDWYDYWLNVHFPGMRKWVLPTLEEELKIQEKRSYTYKDLLDLFDTSVKRFPTRVAMRIERNGRKEQYTFEDVRELTLRAPGFLAQNGIKQGDRVILFSNNMPEWGMTYFGILKAGRDGDPDRSGELGRRDREFCEGRRGFGDRLSAEARGLRILSSDRQSSPKPALEASMYGHSTRSSKCRTETEEAKRNALAADKGTYRTQSRR